MPITVNAEKVVAVGDILKGRHRSLADRFRALFTLRNIGGKTAIDCITACFGDPSALLKHELAYCLGQMQDTYAIPALVVVLKDVTQEPMVRHEAGEALGAIGCGSVIDLLAEYTEDPVPEVAETCQLAVERLKWLHGPQEARERLPANPYASVDPAPPTSEKDIESLQRTLTNRDVSLFDRYRAMFALRNQSTPEAAVALASGLKCNDSALFRHEVAYVLGQMQQPAATQQLTERLKDSTENPMVRHECAEALGAIATDNCEAVLRQHLDDDIDVVRESCIVALDMSDYERADQLEYADGLYRVNKDTNLC